MHHALIRWWRMDMNFLHKEDLMLGSNQDKIKRDRQRCVSWPKSI